MSDLCGSYWYPLYAFVRRRGHSPEDAEDLTQEFFARLLAGDDLSTVAREKGRFRSFLLAVMDHFLAKEWTKSTRLKRGGGCTFIPLDGAAAEDRYRMEPSHDVTPEKLYEQRWALTVLERAMQCMEGELTAKHKADLFAAVRPLLSGETGANSYAETSAALGMTEAAFKMTVSRLRTRFGELVRSEVAQTVARPADLDDEIRHLLRVLQSSRT